MIGRTVVITGATSGIGEVAALALAGQGARIVFVARNLHRGVALMARLAKANPQAAHDWVQGELSTLTAMRMTGDALAEKAPSIDVLINNAGAMFDHRQVTTDGLEMTFAVNHMAYFVLTERLRPNLNPVGGRIVSTASNAHQFGHLDFDDLQFAARYSVAGAYGRSKLCNILWTRELARRLKGTGVTANCLHPGAVSTGFGSNVKGIIKLVMGLGKPFMLTPTQGADTLIWLSASQEMVGLSGGYYTKRRLIQPSREGRNDAVAARLWDVSEKLALEPDDVARNRCGV